MSNQQPGPIGINELPYMDDYLREVLRPRVENALREIEASLAETVWQQLVGSVAGGTAAPEPTRAMIRSLIADRLGLAVQVRLDTVFDPAQPYERRPSQQAGAPDQPAPVVIPAAVRRPAGAMPLVNAVLTSPRPGGR